MPGIGHLPDTITDEVRKSIPDSLGGVSSFGRVQYALPGLVWDTTADWAAATDSLGVNNSGGQLHWDGIYQTADMENDYTDKVGGVFQYGLSPANWTTNEQWNASVGDGSNCHYWYDTANDGATLMYKNISARQLTEPISWCYYEFSSNTNTILRIEDSNGDRVMEVGTNNPQVDWYNGTNSGNLYDPGDYEHWRRITLENWDWDNGLVDYVWEDLTGGNATQSTTLDLGSTVDIAKFTWKHESTNGPWGGSGVDVYLDDVYGPWDGPYTPSLTSDARTADEVFAPGLDLSYDVGEGAVLVEVVGSPGTADEETALITAYGTQEQFYLGSYFSADHDTYRVVPQLDGDSSYADNPTVDRVTVTGELDDSRADDAIEDWDVTGSISGFAKHQETDSDAADTIAAVVDDDLNLNDAPATGEVAVKLETSTSGTVRDQNILSLPGDGLGFYPRSAGDTFRSWVYVPTMDHDSSGNYSDPVAMLFGVDSLTRYPSGYQIWFDPGPQSTSGSGEIRIDRLDDGTPTTLASATGDWYQNTWYQLEARWDSDGTVTAWLLNSSDSQLAEIAATDTNYLSQRGFGYWTEVNSNPDVSTCFVDTPTYTPTDVAASPDGATDVQTTSMVLNGTLDVLSVDSADCSFEWREVGAATWNATTPESLADTGPFSKTVTGLASGTDHEYRTVAQTADEGDTSYAVVQQTAYDLPAVSTDGVDFDGDGTTATLNGTVDRFGDSAEGDVSFEWGPTGSVSSNQTTPTTVTATGPYSDSISGLTEGNDYDYRARIDSPDGDTEFGATKTFTASSVAVMDDFEDTDFSEWTATAGGPSQVTTADAPSGSAVMEYRQGGNDMVYSTTGLGTYPAQGDTFKYWFYINEEDNGEAGVAFGLQDSSNFYDVGIDLNDDVLELSVWSAGSATTLDSAAHDFKFQTWYSMEVVWGTDDSINATAYTADGTQVATTAATDTSYISGGVGVRANDFVGSWTGAYVDHFRVI